MTFLVYVTRRVPGRPPQIEHTQYRPMPGNYADAKTAFLRLLSAVEKRHGRGCAPGWHTLEPALGWELWQVGFVPRPLAAATDTDPAVVCRPHLYDLLGGERALEELHRWWTDTVYSVAYKPAQRATTVRTHTPAAGAGTDPESEIRV